MSSIYWKTLIELKAYLADKGGILKSFEIQYKETNDFLLWTPAAHCKPVLTNFCALLDLFLLEPSKGARYDTLLIIKALITNFLNGNGIP